MFAITLASIGAVASSFLYGMGRYAKKQNEERLIEKEKKNWYRSFWHVWEGETEWRKIDEHAYEIELGDIECVVTHTSKEGELFVRFSNQDEQSLYVFITPDNRLVVIQNGTKEIFDVRRYFREKEDLYRGWGEALKERFQEEESEDKPIFPSGRTARNWREEVEKQNHSFERMMQHLSQVDLHALPIYQQEVCWSDEHFLLSIHRTDTKVTFRILLANHVRLQTVTVNLKKGTVGWDTFVPYVVGEKRQALLKSLANVLKKERAGNRKMQTSPPITTSVRTMPLFRDIRQEIERLREQKEWLTDSEKHLLFHTYPHDIKEIEHLCLGLHHPKEEQTEALLKRAKDDIQSTIHTIQTRIQERKMRQLEMQVRIVEKRE